MLALSFSLFAALLLGTSAAQAAGLNDTGITDCVDANFNRANCAGVAGDAGALPRQDAHYGRDAAAVAGSLPKTGGGGKGFDFSKIANNGSVLPATAGHVGGVPGALWPLQGVGL